MEVTKLKSWLGAGSINIFGLPMSGKDTVGVRLAQLLDAEFLSSGMIIRQVEAELSENLTGDGALIPTDRFYDIILPYFSRPELKDRPLILSSVGRWSGEEVEVISSADKGGHPIKAAILLNLSEDEAEKRRLAALSNGDRGSRADDTSATVFHTRLTEFRKKTLPVLQHYQNLGLLITVDGNQSREAVFHETLEKLTTFATQTP